MQEASGSVLPGGDSDETYLVMFWFVQWYNYVYDASFISPKFSWLK